MNDNDAALATPLPPRAAAIRLRKAAGNRGPPIRRARFREQPGATPSRTRRRRLEAKYEDQRGYLLSLATFMGFHAEDAEDIAQETLLALFAREGTSGSTGDDLVDGLAARSLVARCRSNERHVRLDSAITDAAAETRSERDSRGALWLSPEGRAPSPPSR